MKRDLSHTAKILRNEVQSHGVTYKVLSERTGLTIDHIKNLMCGRATLSILDRDILCQAIGINPADLFIQRRDLADNSQFLDIRPLPDAIQSALRYIVESLVRHHQPTRTRSKRSRSPKES